MCIPESDAARPDRWTHVTRADVSLSQTPRLRVPSCLTNTLRLSLQYGEEEVCSDRLDTDFPDIDLSQLDTSDFDSVNCLSELQWCSDQQVDASPASIHCSTADQLFEVRPRPLNAAHCNKLSARLDHFLSQSNSELETC